MTALPFHGNGRHVAMPPAASVGRLSRGENNTGHPSMSAGDFSGRDEQDHLQAVWIDFLKRNFRTDEEAAHFFGVDESSIRHWKRSRNGLNGVRLFRAAKHFPALRQMLFGAA